MFADSTTSDAHAIAMALWRDGDLTKHRKGSCAGCHGADFFDLARIGSSDDDIVRRALIDGATQEEAEALVVAVNQMRQQLNLPEEDPRTFRPLQPGGEVLLPDLDGSKAIKSVQRDIVFGNQLEQLVPAFFGAPIQSLEAAERARDQLLDLINGTNTQGFNGQYLDLRNLPVGIEYPLWSADLEQGASEGTLNDWVADVARDPDPDQVEEWNAILDAYLVNPSSENFWRMWLRAGELTAAISFEQCAEQDGVTATSCKAAEDFNIHKFRAALTGQHLMRIERYNNDPLFVDGPLAFAYLDDDPRFDFMLDRKDPEFLPGDLWEIGDRSRVMLSNTSGDGSLRDRLHNLNFPDFVQNSVTAQRDASDEQHDLRVPWFWIGFTFDPSFARIHPSNATKVGEYMVGSLLRQNMHIHNSFHTHVRLLANGFLDEANRVPVNRQRTLGQNEPEFAANYWYFLRYGRHELRWNEREQDYPGGPIDSTLKTNQEDLWSRFTGNGIRMSLYLFLDAAAADRASGRPELEPILSHFDAYSTASLTHDRQLVAEVKQVIGE